MSIISDHLSKNNNQQMAGFKIHEFVGGHENRVGNKYKNTYIIIINNVNNTDVVKDFEITQCNKLILRFVKVTSELLAL